MIVYSAKMVVKKILLYKHLRIANIYEKIDLFDRRV